LVTYVSDAVAFLYYLLDKLPPRSDEAFSRAERGASTIYLPTIAAAELLYLFERKQWVKLWSRLKREMRKHPGFHYYPFDEDTLSLFSDTEAPEIHDKIIVSTTKLLKAEALITKDRGIRQLGEVKTLW